MISKQSHMKLIKKKQQWHLKKLIQLPTWILLGCLMSLSPPLLGRYPENLVVVGDSLSDSGNSVPLPPFTPINFYRFAPITDGTTWPVLLSELLDTKKTLLPYVQGGTNFAYVGALTNGIVINPSLIDQVNLLMSPTMSKNDPVFVFGGSNDFFFTTPSSGAVIAQNIENIIQTLHNNGFKNLIIFNLPNLGKIPSSLQDTIFVTESLAFNAALPQLLKTKNYPILQIDFFSMFEDVLNNFQNYGFISNSLLNASGGDPLEVPTAGYAFWYDGTHPTEATHRIIADYVFAILNAPGCYGTLAEEPFAILREQTNAIRQQLYPSQSIHELNVFYPFISGTYSPQTLPALGDSCTGNDAFGGDVTLGVTNRVGDSWELGIAGSYALNNSHCHERNNRCSFRLQAGTLSLFSSFQKPQGYVNTVLNASWLFYDKIKRKFYVGPVLHQAHGDTMGFDYDINVYGAYYFLNSDNDSHISTGPLVNLEFQRVFVDGYKESGSTIGNIVFKNQNNSSFISGLGWEVRFDYQLSAARLITDVFLTANRQWHKKTRLIHFREKSIPGTYGFWPVKMHRSNFASGGLNFSTEFNNKLIFNIGYNCNIGTFRTSEHFITAGLTYPIGFKKSPT